MKGLLKLMIVIFPIVSNAQNYQDDYFSIREKQFEDQIRMENAQGKERAPYYEEDSMLYVRNGLSIGSFGGKREKTTLDSVGYIRYSNYLITGFEYNSFMNKETKDRSNGISAIFGYRVLWRRNFLPYSIIQFGIHDTNIKSGAEHRDSSIFTNVDLGIDFFKLWKVKFSSGIRHSTIITTAERNPSFTDLYLKIGFVF